MKKCNSCNFENEDISRFCVSCGKPLENDQGFKTQNTLSFNQSSSQNEFKTSSSVNSFTNNTTIPSQSPLSFTKAPAAAPQPNPTQNTNSVSSLAKKPGWIFGIILALIIGVFAYTGYQENVKKEYLENFSEVVDIMVSSASDAEDLMILTSDVWYNAIWEVYDYTTNKYTRTTWGYYYDYNVALSNLYGDSTTISTINGFVSDQRKVDSLMSKLKNPPSEYASDYQNLLRLYDAYVNLIEAASDPTGSYITYTASRSTLVTTFITCYDRVK